MKTTEKGKINFYTYSITWSKEDKMFVGLCAEFPSLSWLDDTQEKALKGIKNVVFDVITDMENSHETVPQPFSEKKYSGTLTLRIPPEVHRNLAICAAQSNVSLNRYINSKVIG